MSHATNFDDYEMLNALVLLFLCMYDSPHSEIIVLCSVALQVTGALLLTALSQSYYNAVQFPMYFDVFLTTNETITQFFLNYKTATCTSLSIDRAKAHGSVEQHHIITY